MRLLIFISLVVNPLFLFSQDLKKDTTISFSEYALLYEESQQLNNCNEIVEDKNLQIYNFKNVLREKQMEINSLSYRNAELIKAIKEHNEKLKNSQEKFKINLN